MDGKGDFLSAFDNPASYFAELLRALGSEHVDPRLDRDVATNKGGEFWIVYPKGTYFEHFAGEIRRVAQLEDVPSLFKAIVLLVLLGGYHPYLDFNGRLSRVFFSISLSHFTGRRVFVPLKDAAILSRGNFLISARHAHFYDEWEPIFVYFHKLFAHVVARHEIRSNAPG